MNNVCISMVDTSATAAAAIAHSKIYHFNDKMVRLLGRDDLNGLTPDEMIPPIGLSGMVAAAITSAQSTHVERRVNIGRECVLWIGIAPAGPHRAILTLYDTSLELEMLVMLAKRMRKTKADHVWVLDENLYPLRVIATQTLQEQASTPGFTPLDAMTPPTRENALAVAARAKRTPGQRFSTVVRGYRDGHETSVYVDVIFYVNTLSGGRFICSTRVRDIAATGVVNRLKIAHKVETDIELAAALKTTPSAVTRARRTNTIPSRWIVGTWEATGASMDWIGTGIGEMF